MDCTQNETVHRLLGSQKVVLPALRVGHIISPAQNLGVLSGVSEFTALLCSLAVAQRVQLLLPRLMYPTLRDS